MALTPDPGRSRPGWVIRRFGRRGVLLVLLGTLYVASGSTTLAVQNRRFGDLPLVGALLDSPALGALWLVCGLVAIAAGLRRPRPDAVGWGALLIPPAIWTLFYVASWGMWLATGGQYGRATAAAGIFTLSITWTVVLVCAGWPEIRHTPDDPPPGTPPAPETTP